MEKKYIYFGENDENYLCSDFNKRDDYVGEYIDVIRINNKYFLFTKGASEFKKGVIDVREVIQNVCSDGSSVVYANKEKNRECEALEAYFNKVGIKSKLDQGAPLLYLFYGMKLDYGRANFKSFNDNNQLSMVISVKEVVFEDAKKKLLDCKNKSFYDLQCELAEAKAKRKYFN